MRKRVSFVIDSDLLDRLRSMKARTGLSEADQMRQAIRMWLDSREWPPPREIKRPSRDE